MSIRSSYIAYIVKNDFLDILKKYPIDYEAFCYLKDEINISSEKTGDYCS